MEEFISHEIPVFSLNKPSFQTQSMIMTQLEPSSLWLTWKRNTQGTAKVYFKAKEDIVVMNNIDLQITLVHNAYQRIPLSIYLLVIRTTSYNRLTRYPHRACSYEIINMYTVEVW